MYRTLILLGGLVLAGPQARAQDSVVILRGSSPGDPGRASQACRRGTWINCGLAVRHELAALTPSDTKAVIDLAVSWANAYDVQIEALRRQGRLERATPAAERVERVLDENFNPISIAQDQAEEALLKRYLPKLAVLFEWASAPWVAAAKAYFDGQDIATDYDELRQANDLIQEQIMTLLAPHLRSDWKDRLNEIAVAAGAQLKKP